MTFKDLAKKLQGSVQTVPNLINVLAEAFNEMEEGGGGSSEHNYSIEEHKIGKWIDGSDLYEKSFTLPGAITINNSSWVSTGISISSIKNVVDGELNRNGTQKFLCSIRAANSVIELQTYFDGVQCDTNSVVTVQYTKA